MIVLQGSSYLRTMATRGFNYPSRNVAGLHTLTGAPP